AEATELPGGVLLHVGIVDWLEIVRMRIERGQHAGDGGMDQLALVRDVNVLGADAVEDLAEQRQVRVDLGVAARFQFGARGRRFGGLLLRDQRRHPDGSQGENDQGGAERRDSHQELSTLGRVVWSSPPSGWIDGLVILSHLNIKRWPRDTSTARRSPGNCP